MEPIVIQADKIGFKTGNNFIVKDVDWTVRQGEHWIIFGLNGCGKTTLLSLIAGYRNYTNGDLHVFGEQFDETNTLALRQKIGWVSGSYFEKCYTRESVLDIVLSGKFATLGMDYQITEEDVQNAKKLLTAFRLKKVISHPFNILSNGERQCVLIARALMAKPEILIMDEPCSGLDIFSRQFLLNFIKDVANKTHMTLIFVTHYTEEIEPEFEHCLLLREGKSFACGLTRDIFCSETISKFINYPVQVTWQKDGIDVDVQVSTPVDEWISCGLLPK